MEMVPSVDPVAANASLCFKVSDYSMIFIPFSNLHITEISGFNRVAMVLKRTDNLDHKVLNAIEHE